MRVIRVSPRSFALLVVSLTAAGVFAYAMPKRISTIVQKIQRKVEVAHGCTVFSPGIFNDEDRFMRASTQISEIQRDGELAMYDTPIGSLWYPIQAWTLPAVVEKNEEDEYHLLASIHPGDIVLDVGAHVGTETRSALNAGARLVVAMEPDPRSLECLRRNLISEIREKRVVVVPKGAWDKSDMLPLHLDPDGGGASFTLRRSPESVQIPVTTIDEIVDSLELPKVDLIKIHVEGAEGRALLGAAGTIRRHHPRLAVTLEHNLNDAGVLPKIARDLWPGYHLKLTSCTKTFNLIHPGAALLTP